MVTVEPIRKKSDIQKVKNILKQQSLINFLLFLIGINCGLRISDILNLDWLFELLIVTKLLIVLSLVAV